MPTVTSHSHSSHQDSYVRARIDSQTKALATDALNAMGLSVSDAIRLLMLHIVEEKNLPFTLKVPKPHHPRRDCAVRSGQRTTIRRLRQLAG